METNRKRSRGFLKGKMMPFNRDPKPSPVVHQYTTTATKVKPSQSSPSTASVGFLVHQDYAVSQSQPKPKVFVLADTSLVGHVLEEIYGIDGDEGVDGKAASYISSVQERWKLEQVNSERMNFQEKVN